MVDKSSINKKKIPEETQNFLKKSFFENADARGERYNN